ncbi:hypothetical protein [Saccharothrix australiensis]|uniref:hypothetical protein n=1 Tax=Saccharothrix australiensis TaxID=2072 RepID=UPI001B87B4F4|nr:hypothetical protein [Saccharothrix australiensis]
MSIHSAVHGKAGEVDHRLIVTQQQTDQQGCAAVVDVHRSLHIARQREHIADQLLLAVEHPARQHRLPSESITTQW